MSAPAPIVDSSPDITGTLSSGLLFERVVPTFEDASGNGHTGIGAGAGPAIASSPWSGFGSAFDFDGVDDRIDCGVAVTTTGVFTLEGKINPDVTTVSRTIAGRWAGSGVSDTQYLIEVAAGVLMGYVRLANDTVITLNGGAVSAATSHDVALEWDGSTYRLYKAGTVVASSASAVAPRAADGVTPFTIGWRANVPTTPFDGKIDEVRLSNVARYAGAYTPATSPFTDDASTVGLWHADAAVDQEVIEIQEGDLLVAHVGGAFVSSPSADEFNAPAGFDPVEFATVDGGVAVGTSVFTKVATDAEPGTYAFTCDTAGTTSGLAGKLLVVRGVRAVTASESGTAISGSSTQSTPAIDVDDVNALILRFGAWADTDIATATVAAIEDELYDFGTDPTSAVAIAASSEIAFETGTHASSNWTLSLSGADSRAVIALVLAPAHAVLVLGSSRSVWGWEATATLSVGTSEDEFPEPVHEVSPPDPRVFIKRRIRTVPDPELDERGYPVEAWESRSTWGEEEIEDYGRYRVKVGGKWVTFWRGVPTQVLSYSDREPFGYGPARIRFPQITTWEPLPSWLRDGANVDIYLERPDGSLEKRWEGLWVAEDDNIDQRETHTTIDCIGALDQLDLTLRRPRLVEHKRNVGELLAEIITPYGRDRRSMRFRPLKPVTFAGIETIASGDFGPTLTGYCQDLLGQSWLEDGSSQWTITVDPGRKPRLVLKDRTTAHYSKVVGEPGFVCRLKRDLTQAPTTLFAEGINDDGCRWRNSKYPNTRVGDAPVFSGTPIEPGDTHIDYGLFSQEMYDRSWTEFDPGANTYDFSEEAAVRAFQRDAGVTADGIVDAQTWAAAFLQGSDANSILGSYIHPIYSKVYTEYYKRAPDGSIIGRYEEFDAKRLRIERHVNMGKYVNKEEGRRSAVVQIERDHVPAYFGRLVLHDDPPEGSRFDIKSGENFLVRCHRGVDRLVHIAERVVNLEDMSVTLTVDEKARDAMTLAAMLDRDRSTNDPNRRPKPRYFNASRKVEDRAIVFDCENGAGIVPRHAITAGEWNRIRVPFGKYGRIVRAYFNVDIDSRMAVGVFARPVTANQLKALGTGVNTGDPLHYEDYWKTFPAPGDNPDNLPGPSGLVQAWGSRAEPGGFHPGRESANDPLTGILQDDAGWDYVSLRAPWLWVALWVETGDGGFHSGTNYIRGRFSQSNDTV